MISWKTKKKKPPSNYLLLLKHHRLKFVEKFETNARIFLRKICRRPLPSFFPSQTTLILLTKTTKNRKNPLSTQTSKSNFKMLFTFDHPSGRGKMCFFLHLRRVIPIEERKKEKIHSSSSSERKKKVFRSLNDFFLSLLHQENFNGDRDRCDKI